MLWNSQISFFTAKLEIALIQIKKEISENYAMISSSCFNNESLKNIYPPPLKVIKLLSLNMNLKEAISLKLKETSEINV